MTVKEFAQEVNRRYGKPIMYAEANKVNLEKEKALCKKATINAEIIELVTDIKLSIKKLNELLSMGE